jgi:nitrilase
MQPHSRRLPRLPPPSPPFSLPSPKNPFHAPTSKKPKVGVIQATPALFNLDATIDIVCDWIAKGAAEHCDLLLFPESFIPCYPRGFRFDAMIGKRTDQGREMWLDYWQNAIEVPSSHLDKISSAIKKTGLMVAL